MILTFDPPIAHDGNKIERVELREPLAREVLAAEKAGMAEFGYQSRQVRDRVLVAAVAGVDAEAVKLWPMALFRKAERFVNGFSQPPKKGEKAPGDAELTIELDQVIEKHNRRVDLLELRPPTAGEVETAQRELGSVPNDETVRSYQIVLVALVAGYPRGIIGEVPISKLDQASRYLQGFT